MEGIPSGGGFSDEEIKAHKKDAEELLTDDKKFREHVISELNKIMEALRALKSGK